MRTARFLGAILAVALFGSACTSSTFEVQMGGCRDMTVGEEATVTALAQGYEQWSWSYQGPGTLTEIDSGRAVYSATDPGSVRIDWIASTVTRVITVINFPLSANFQEARCDFTVYPGGVGLFEVTSTLTQTNFEGGPNPGSVSSATWNITFDCVDDRCDGRVDNGGAYGGLKFEIIYQVDTSSFSFGWVLDSTSSECPRSRTEGQLLPVAWDDAGLAAFTHTISVTTMCITGDFVSEWEGEGSRR